MIDLVTFLTECLDADEATARDAALVAGDRGIGDERVESGKRWTTSYHLVVRDRVSGQSKKTLADTGGFVGLSLAPHIARHDPARVLAQVAAMRAIVELHSMAVDLYEQDYCTSCLSDRTGFADEWEADLWPCPTLRALASIYADQPGWQESWAL